MIPVIHALTAAETTGSEPGSARSKISDILSSLMFIPELKFYSFATQMFFLQETTELPTLACSFDRQFMKPVILYNPDFVMKLKDGEVVAVLIHEVWHFLNRTFARQGLRDMEKWNIATDAIMNHHIKQDVSSKFKTCTLPEGCIDMDKYGIHPAKPEDLTSEWFYDQLNDKNNKNAQQMLKDFQSGKIKLVDEHGVGDDALEDISDEIIKANVGEIIKQATQLAGSSPAGASAILKELYESVVNWVQILRDFVGHNTKIGKRKSWKREHRMELDMVPGKQSLRSGKLCVLVDTSGSTAQDLPQFFGEIEMISSRFEVTVVQCDAAVQKGPDKYRRGMPIEIKGYGGTCMEPGLQLIHDKVKPDMIVVFTDGYLFDKPGDRGIPELWVISSNGQEVPGKRNIKMVKQTN